MSLIKKFSIALLLLITVYGSAYAASPWADEIKVDTTNFDKNLSASDNNIQKALDTIDNLSAGKTAIHFIIDGGGSVITAGSKSWIRVPYAMTITGWNITADQSGSCVIDVWKNTYANFPPSVLDTIAGAEKPALTDAQKNQDTDLTTWTISVNEGDYIRINVESASMVTLVYLTIYGEKQ